MGKGCCNCVAHGQWPDNLICGSLIKHALTCAGCTGPTPGFSCPAGSEPFGCPSAQCRLCTAGYFSKGGNLACLPCPAGTYSPDGATFCTPCPPDTYSGTAAAGSVAACTSCPSGYASFQGSSSSGQCIAGACANYQITAANLQQPTYSCGSYNGFSPTSYYNYLYASYNAPISIGFSWMDATSCAIAHVYIQVRGAYNCDTSPGPYPAILNGIPTSSSLSIAGSQCPCQDPPSTSVLQTFSLTPADIAAYTQGSSNSVSFTATSLYNNYIYFGLATLDIDYGGLYAEVIVTA